MAGLRKILLVDDGSPDRCPAMCDAWTARDERIRVIHKANGGLSDARRWGAIAWVAIALAMPALFLGWYGARDAWGMVFLAALLAHGLDGARRLWWPAAAGTRA